MAIGYFFYSTYTRYNLQSQPIGFPVLALAVGTLIPDLVDKPLAYWTPLLPEGRTLAHSMLIGIPVCIALLAVAERHGFRNGAIGFTIGYLSHPLADSLVPLVSGRSDELTFLLWPMLPVPDYPSGDFHVHFLGLLESTRELTVAGLLTDWTNVFVIELWFTAAMIGLWISHGLPPLPSVRYGLQSVHRSLTRK